MPDRDDNTTADEQTIPETPLHGYKEGRRDDVSGDTDRLESNDPGDQQQSTLEGEGELDLPHEKH